MGLVQFSVTGTTPAPGYLVDDEVIDLSCDVFEYHNSIISWLPQTEKLDNKIRNLRFKNELEVHSVDDVTLHRPIRPRKIVCLEGCYKHDVTDEGFNTHLEDAGLNELEWPSLWIAPTSVSNGPKSAVAIPPRLSDVRPGVELCMVVGERIKKLPVSRAMDSIAGYTVATNLTAHDELPGLEGYRMFDGFLPIGPAIVPTTSVDPENLMMSVQIGDDRLDHRTTADFRFTPAEMVAHVSECMTLNPGDLLATGNPTRIDQALEPGNRVRTEIAGIGSQNVQIEEEECD